MTIQVEDYFEKSTFAKMKAFADTQETPFVVIDTAMISKAYDDLRAGFEFAKVYYAVKANPAVEIIDLLKDKGSSFDIASIYELDKVMAQGVGPDRISYGNTIKKSKDIRYFYEKGVRLFSTDSEADLRNIAKAAPGSKIYVRILTEGSTTADWPLSRKFGCQTDMAMDLLILARDLGLVPYGISFHVGSQQRDISVWDAAIAKVKVIFGATGTEAQLAIVGTDTSSERQSAVVRGIVEHVSAHFAAFPQLEELPQASRVDPLPSYIELSSAYALPKADPPRRPLHPPRRLLAG